MSHIHVLLDDGRVSDCTVCQAPITSEEPCKDIDGDVCQCGRYKDEHFRGNCLIRAGVI